MAKTSGKGVDGRDRDVSARIDKKGVRKHHK